MYLTSLSFRSKLLYNRQTGALIGLTLCENNESLASASANGSIFVMRIESSSNKVTLLHSRQLNMQEDGSAVDINYLDSSECHKMLSVFDQSFVIGSYISF